MALAISYVGWRFGRIRPLLDPEPLVIVENGRPIERNLRKERVTVEEVAAEARIQRISSLEDVQWAVIESGGRISFVPKNARAGA
jgi:uncharacterized membrane protein YcaP (DUF421 family)